MLLGIDQGTTGTRVCLVDDDGRIVRQAYAKHAQHLPRPGWVEHDADEIWKHTRRLIGDVLAAGARPVGLALSNQGETIMIWDAQTRRPLHRALVWQDTRTEATIARLASFPGNDARVRAETGLRLDSYFSASKLQWLLDEVPGARALAAAGRLRAGTMDTWLVDRLTGGRVFATDASTAARTLLCETATCTWSPFLLELFQIPREILPEIRDSDAGFGECAGDGLDGIPIIASLVDQPAALAGQGRIDAMDAKATFGTGCFVYVNTGNVRPSAPQRTLGTVAWRRAGETCYALDGGVLAVGSAIGWLRELGLVGGDNLLDALPPRRDAGVVCVPALVGLGAPHWDRESRGTWLGLSSATTREDLAGAVLEGIACRVAEVVRATELDAGITVAELSVDGGLSRARGLMQLQADLLGRPIVVAEEDEASIVGVCAIAALRLGTLSAGQLRTWRTRSRARYEPQISADERATRLERFARAVAIARQWR
jgi:glycerol kinase